MINYINGNNQPDAINHSNAINQNKIKAVNQNDMNEWINHDNQTIIKGNDMNNILV